MFEVVSVLPGLLFLDRLRLGDLLGLLGLLRWTHGLLQVSVELRHDAWGQKCILRWLNLLLFNASHDILGLDIRTISIIVQVNGLLCGIRQLIDFFRCHSLDRWVSGPEQICVDVFTLNSSNPIDKGLELWSRLFTCGARIYQSHFLWVVRPKFVDLQVLLLLGSSLIHNY